MIDTRRFLTGSTGAFMTRGPLLGASIVAWLALVTIGPAWADCMTSCMAGKGCGLQYESGRVQSGYCSIGQSHCEVQCRRDQGSGATYGAIAFSPSTGAWGDAYRHGNRAEAGIWAGGLGGTQAAASHDAMADCLKHGGKTCETQHAVCSR
jgi:hypothetical protein